LATKIAAAVALIITVAITTSASLSQSVEKNFINGDLITDVVLKTARRHSNSRQLGKTLGGRLVRTSASRNHHNRNQQSIKR
jgi:hypothetical protein